jgi:hypothetical protein
VGSKLSVAESTLSGNSVSAGLNVQNGLGGALFTGPSARVAILDSDLSNNTVVGGVNVIGGAVFVFSAGQLTVEGCNVRGNVAVAGSESMNLRGGGIGTIDKTVVVVLRTEFRDNVVRGRSTPYVAGGAFWLGQ